MTKRTPPKLTDEDARVSMSWPAYQTLKRRPSWRLALLLAGSTGLFCGACSWLQGYLAH